MIDQLPLLLGTAEPQFKKSVFHKFVYDATMMKKAHWPTVLVGFGSLFFVFGCRMLRKFKICSWLKYVPGIFVLIVLVTTLSYTLHFDKLGIHTVDYFDFEFPAPR